MLSLWWLMRAGVMQWCGSGAQQWCHSMAPLYCILRCAVVAGACLDVQVYGMGDVFEQCSWALGMGLAVVCRA